MSNDDTGEKNFDPTPKKLEDARRKGEVAKSADLSAAAAYLGLCLALVFAGSQVIHGTASHMAGMLEGAVVLSDLVFDGGGQVFLRQLILSLIAPLALIFILPAILVIISYIAQRSIVFAPEKLLPKLNRISPLSTLKNKFGRNGLFEFGKSTTKLVIVSCILGWYFSQRLDDLLLSTSLQPAQTGLLMGDSLQSFLILIFVMSATIGAVDYFWQFAAHLRKNRMSRKDIEDETKQSEGDPHLKQQRRQRGYEIAMNKMLTEVPEADVIIVNPTHYAVALKWDPLSPAPPSCIAKGTDEIAARIREVAQEAHVPIYSDPPTARAIYAKTEIGDFILPEDYKAVAVAIRFAQQMRAKARS